MKYCTVYMIVFFLSITLVTVSSAAEQMPLSDSISIKADSLQHDQGKNRYLATGKVVITWSGMSLNSDQAEYDTETKELVATGNVMMTKGEDVLTGTKFSVNVETGRSELEHGTLDVRKGNIHFTGEKIVRDGEQSLLLTKTELTTCDLPNPSWKFAAEKLDVNLLGYATGRNIIFYVKDVPVLYLPWIAFPVVRDRKSGLLFPRFGYSSKSGAEVVLPAYLVIAPNQDIQLDLDLQSRRGVGAGMNYRYALNRGSEGDAGGYLIYDVNESRWRGQFAEKHTEVFSDSMNLRSSINVTSDQRFLNEFGEKSGDYNRQSNESTVNFLKVWQNFAMTSLVRYSDDMYTDSNTRTLQKMPEVGLSAVKLPIFKTPLYLDFDSSAVNFYREAGVRGTRFSAAPRLTLPLRVSEFLNASVYAGLAMRAYETGHDPDKTVRHSTDGIIIPEVGARVSMPISRVYALQTGSLEKIRHEIVPEVSYRYIPHQDQSRLPFYDYDDRIVSGDIVSWSLTNHIGGRFKQGDRVEYRDLMRFMVSQGYSFSGSRRNLLTMVDAHRRFDDLAIESDTWLLKDLKLTFDSRYNLYDNRITSAVSGMEFTAKRGTVFGVGYRMARNEVEYGEIHVSTKFLKPWVLDYASRFSFDKSAFLESVYSAEYIQKCWSVTFVFRDRPGNKTGTVNFNLAGLTGN